MTALPQPPSLSARAWRIALYALATALPMAVALGTAGGFSGSVYALGQCAAMLAFGVLTVQLVLASRWLWVERPFGLDRVYRFHRLMGVVAAGLLLTHPTLLALGGEGTQLFTNLAAPWYIWLGKGVLLTAALLVLAALFRQALRIEFELWRRAHGLVAVLILAGALTHALNAGTDLQTMLPRAVFVAYAAAAVTAVAVAKWRAGSDRPRAHTVQSVTPETANAWTVTLEPSSGGPAPSHLPGQFHFLTFRSKAGPPRQEHPFTISSDPTRPGSVSSTIKASGDFTAQIGELKPGDTAVVSVPYGRFSYVLHPDEADLVFIAGGIGITPLMSMVRHMRSTQADRSVLLLYGNRAEGDIVFREELAAIEAGGTPRLRVIHVLSRAGESWTGERGHTDREKVERLCGALAGKAFYVCGPPPMMRSVIRALRSLQVPASRIHYEHFAL